MLEEFINFITNRIAAHSVTPIPGQDGGPQTIIVPQGHDLKILPGHIAPKPPFITQNVTLATPAAFLAYLGKFKSELTTVFSDVNGRAVEAVIDYHKDDGNAERCAHRARWAMTLDELFQPWFDINDRVLAHDQFIGFLDDHGDSIVSPSSKELLAMVEQIEVISTGSRLSFVAQRGERAALCVKAEDAVQAKSDTGEIIKPIREFTVKLPVQQGGALRDVKINVSWSIKGGTLGVKLSVHELKRLLRSEFEGGVATIRAVTTVFDGALK